MSLAADAREEIAGQTRPAERGLGLSSPRWLIFAACTAAALLINYALGKEMAWDTLDYHLYVGFSAVHDRFANDYFAAGPPSYDNPYAYLPFYALIRAGIPALWAATLLAAFQSVVLWLVFEIALAVSPSEDRRTRLVSGVVSVALALANPILLQQIGTSFADITTAIPVLAGWLLLVQSVQEQRTSKLIWAGLLMGAATGLKPTNAVHAISAVALVVFIPAVLRIRARHLFHFGAALATGFALVSAPWSYHLERVFGNPFFPLLNNIFRSPEFTTVPLVGYRFLPDSLAAALWRPFAIVNPVPLVQEELRAPDLRYAALLIVAALVCGAGLWRRFIRASSSCAQRGSAGALRPLAALGCGFLIDWVLWLSLSGNGRYFLPMACVAAVLLVALLFRGFEARPKVRNYILGAILAAQFLQLWMGTDFRWDPEPWDGGPWFELSIPKPLDTQPNLFLSIGVQSDSFLVPFFPVGAGFTNVSGSYNLGGGKNLIRVRSLIHRYFPNVRVLLRGERLYERAEQGVPLRSEVDDILEPYGLRVDPSDCKTITIHGLHPDLQITIARPGLHQLERRPSNTTFLITCGLVVDRRDHRNEIAQQAVADRALNALEDACPELFQPRRPTSQEGGDAQRGYGWRRLYLNTDLAAWVSHGWVKFQDEIRMDPMITVGRESDWAAGVAHIECGRRDGHYFARQLDSTRK